MPTRREVLLGISTVTLIPAPAKGTGTVAQLLSELRCQIEDELPDVKQVEITYDPTDKRLPLMVMAYRF